MKRMLLLASFFAVSSVCAETSFDVRSSLDPDAGNALGMAYDDSTGHFFVTTLSYSGVDNLYKFDAAGNLLSSVRVPYDYSGTYHKNGAFTDLTVAGDSLFIHASRYITESEYSYDIVEMDKHTNEVLAVTQHWVDGYRGQGIAYNPISGELYSADKKGPSPLYQLATLDQSMTIVDVQGFTGYREEWAHEFRGLAYNSATDSLWSTVSNDARLLEYRRADNGNFELAYLYDLGFNVRASSVDINESTGEIHAMTNQRIHTFGPGELLGVSVPIPEIDVLPGDSANQVYPNMMGILPVAILSSAWFDATQVDPATLRFGSAQATIAEAVLIEEVDGNPGVDMIASFHVEESGIFCNDTDVTLTGATYAGDAFTGSDAIDATDCETAVCHLY